MRTEVEEEEIIDGYILGGSGSFIYINEIKTADRVQFDDDTTLILLNVIFHLVFPLLNIKYRRHLQKNS